LASEASEAAEEGSAGKVYRFGEGDRHGFSDNFVDRGRVEKCGSGVGEWELKGCRLSGLVRKTKGAVFRLP
jgi:hypothetical protein